MAMILRWVRAGLFAAFLCLPVGSLLVLDAAPPYGRPFTALPSLEAIVATTSGRTDLAAALLDRSPLRRAAIKAENALLYNGFGYVDTPLVVSGRDGWLFYKEEFWGGRCLPTSYFADRLGLADTLQDMAETAGFRLVIAVAPDKSSIYPEMLARGARAYTACKSVNGDTWRRIAREIAPRIIDHAEPLLAAKRSNPGVELFFATDTHWTPFAAALARRQLVAALTGGKIDGMPAPRIAGNQTRLTDMLNAMLLLDLPETVPEIDPSVEAAFASRSNAALGRITTVVHDSFYGSYADQFQALFRDTSLFSFESDDKPSEARLKRSELVVASSVERSFFGRLDSSLSWSGPIGRTILERNKERARQCDGFAAAPILETPTIRPYGVSRDGIASRATGDDPQIPIRVPASPGSLPCLSVDIQSDRPDVLEVFLPAKDSPPDAPAFGGRSLRVPLTAGKAELRIVLPAYVAGRPIRVDPSVSASSVRVTIQTGTRRAQ